MPLIHDRHPDWQEPRTARGIAFTGHIPEDDYILLCPADYRRNPSLHQRWAGNRPKK